jgi:glycosyltransferase involved in cell wall biosynthesis
MTNQKLVSVLIPTRGRPQLLVGCVDSLFSLAKDMGRVEIIFGVDQSDRPSIDRVSWFTRQWPGQIKVVQFAQDRGYEGLHCCYNELARNACGEWLFLFNDDARIISPGWDESIEILTDRSHDGVQAIVPVVHGRMNSSEFIFVRRKMFEVLGHLSRHHYVDTWLYTVLLMIDRVLHHPGITVVHFVDQLADETAAKKRLCEKSHLNTLRTSEHILAKLEDVRVLLKYIDNHRKQLVIPAGLLPKINYNSSKEEICPSATQ